MMFGRGGVAAVEAVVAAAATLTRTYTARAEDAVRWTMLAGGGLLGRKGEGAENWDLKPIRIIHDFKKN